jgi:hypothetical protein
MPVVIENRLAISRGIELPPAMPRDVSPEPLGFEAFARGPENGLVAIAESACGPGPRTRIAVAPAERISHEAEVEYSGSLAEGEAPVRVEVTFEWEEFLPEAPYERRFERATWVVCVSADEARCVVDAGDAGC